MPMTRAELEQRLPRHQAALRSYVARNITDRHHVDDIVHDVLLSALRNVHQLRDPDKLGAWLNGIAFYRISLAYKEKKWASWAALEHELEAAGESRQKSLLETFDAMFQLLAAADVGAEETLTVALRFCLNWSPPQIAGALGIRPNTVHQRVRRAKTALQRNLGMAARPTIDNLNLQFHLVGALINEGCNPSEGENFRNRRFVEEARNLLLLMRARHPGHIHVLNFQLRIAAIRLQLSQYADDREPVRYEDAFLRERWDPALAADVRRYYDELIAMNPPPGVRLDADYVREFYLPARNEDVDWKRILEISERRLKLDPVIGNYFASSQAVKVLQGPLAAARYLETHRRNRTLRHLPVILGRLSYYYYLAGEWSKSRRYARQFRKWPRNRAILRMVEERIAACDARLRRRRA